MYTAGNVISGNALVEKLAVSALTSSTAPTASDVTWSYKTTDYITSKAARGLSDGSVVALLFNAPVAKQATLVKLTSAGAVSWGPTDYADYQGEGTDVVVSADGNSFVICGQGPGHSSETAGTSYVAGAYFGRLTKVSSTGTREWSKSYTSTPYDGSAGTYAKLIKNECWGIQPLSDGYLVGCGTGIEDCNGLSGAEKTACDAGTPDTRTGAVPRQKSIWQSMMFKTDLSGTLQWLRTDQYVADATAGEQCTSSQQNKCLSSASEYPIVKSDGGIVSINDEGMGIGLLVLNADGTNSVAPSASPSPSAPPPSGPASAATASPPPSPPPLTEAEVTARTIVITIVAAGEVSDYADGSAKANLIKTNLANTAKVDVSAITLKVTAARYPLATHVSCALSPYLTRSHVHAWSCHESACRVDCLIPVSTSRQRS